MNDCEQCKTVRVLLDAGASCDEKDDLGRTPFYFALDKKNYGVMRELVRKGADINLPINEKNETYLHKAIMKFESPKLVQFLLDLGADVNRKDIYGLSAIQKAALTGDSSLLEVLVANGANISARDSNGWTLLHCAARYGNISAVSWLIKNGVDLEAKSNNGRTALHFAAQYGQAEVVEVMLEGGAKMNTKDDSGWTALRWANYRGHKAVVDRIIDRSGGGGSVSQCCECATIRALLKSGASHDLKDSNDMTPFQIALVNKNFNVMRELVKGGSDINYLINEKKETYLHTMVVRRESPEIVQFLIDLGSNINQKDIFGLSPVQKAAFTGDTVLLQLLDENGADLSLCDGNGWTLLHCAVRCGNANAVDWLIGRGLEVEAKSSSGKTALHLGAKHGHQGVVKVLLRRGAQVTVEDASGWTPLRWAKYRGHRSVVQLLMDQSRGKI